MLQTLGERIATAILRSQQYENAQHERVQAQERATVLQETMDRMDAFLGLASHELRTPLTSLAMNIQIMDYWINSERPKQADETESAYLARAVAAVRPFIQRSGYSVKRLNRLIGDLLDATYVREERLAIRPERIDLVAVVREVVDEQRRMYASRTLSLEAEAEAIYVNADLDRIAQVLSNYISNALKYSGTGYPITVNIRVEGDQARVAVRDRGVGIPSAELEHIWERLYRVASIEHLSGSRVGLGLGLYISRDIIERHGGQVGADSAPGEGSTFWFTLPLAQPEVTYR
jgi:signal transduction histidine kinase